MPGEVMNEQQVAAYLQMDLRELRKLASRGNIPCRRTKQGFVFRKGQVDHWVFENIDSLEPEQLAGIQKGVSDHHGFDRRELLVAALIPPKGIVVPLEAKTRPAALRALVDVADGAGLVYVRDDLLEELTGREELCPTTVLHGVAMPHPRHPLPYDIAESFVVVGLTATGIPYGAEDGSLTRLLFLVCCKDERTHLHVLARLAQMLHETGAIDDLLEAGSPDDLRRALLRHEQAVIESDAP